MSRHAGPLLEVRDLVRHFGGLKAVDGVSFTVERGEVLGLVGPNGSGKSTVLGLISGRVAPMGGEVRLDRGGGVVEPRGVLRPDGLDVPGPDRRARRVEVGRPSSDESTRQVDEGRDRTTVEIGGEPVGLGSDRHVHLGDHRPVWRRVELEAEQLVQEDLLVHRQDSSFIRRWLRSSRWSCRTFSTSLKHSAARVCN